MAQIHLDFYSVHVAVQSDVLEILDDLKRDFDYFLSKDAPSNIALSIFRQSPPYQLVPPVKASLYLPGAITYDDGQKRFVDYNGELLTVYDYKNEEGAVYSEDLHLLYEVSYLVILSRMGELLDRQGIHRLHGLGITFNDKTVLCLLPASAGKSTLLLDLLEDNRVKLLSDDMSLCTRGAEILPFPIRVGIAMRENLRIPQEYLREFKRRQYGFKRLIDISYFNNRIATKGRPCTVLIGERTFSNQPKIECISKLKTFIYFVRDGVIGLGLPQMVEYFLRHNIKDLHKVPIVCSRIIASTKVIACSRCYKVILGRDRRQNALALINFLERIC